ncbi:MAG: molybdopterin cofactor-binding domain-containing protein, partial [Dehalococcoidia bacterium]
PMLDELSRRAWDALGPPSEPEPGIRIGRGMAAAIIPFGRMSWTHDSSSAWVGMEADGTAMVRSAAPDVGGGQPASLIAITAEVLGLPIDRVTITPADSHMTPRAGTSTATRQLLMSGNATLKAAREVRNNLVAQASEMLGVPESSIELKDGEAVAADGRRLGLAEVVKGAIGSGRPVEFLAKYNAPAADIIDPHTGQGKPFNDYTFGVQVAEVEVDEETGQVGVRRFVTAFDVGKAINPAAVEGQLQGGVGMGIGDALMEEVVIEEGFTRNPHLMDYKLPTTLDMPDIETVVLESGQGLGPFGAKGIGEPAVIPPRATIVNAVSDAIGVQLREAPLTPERVYRAMRTRDDS